MTDQTDNDDIVLEINDVGISYFTRIGEIPAVPDFSLKLKRGESYGLVGESGCGKSTVAMAIMNYLGKNGGVVRGQIKFEGRDMADMSGEELRDIRGSKIAMVYQEPMSALNPSLTIGTQLKEVLVVHEGISDSAAAECCIQMLRDVNMPDPESVMGRYPHQISGGQQQRVVIAMAMLSNPSLLLLDEPTTALDVTVEATVIDLIANLREKYNTTLLYISHNLGLIVKVCDRVGVMYSGSMVEEGTIEELFKKTRHPYTFGLFDCIPTLGADKHARTLEPIPGQVSLPHERPPGCSFGPRCKYFKLGTCDQGHIPIENMDGSATHRARCRRVDEIEHVATNTGSEVTVASGETVLHINGMSKFYEVSDISLTAIMKGESKHYVRANEELNFEAQRGRTVAIVGESGCGKSTFAKVLTGLETATDGEIMFEGTNIGVIPVQKRDAKMIRALQMVFQNPDGTLNPSHSVGHCIGRVIKKFGIEKNPKKVREKVGEMLDIVRLPKAFITRKPRQLSGGQKQRIAVARAFAGNPSMVIADEPVSALDVSVQAAVINLLNDVQKEFNTTLLFISHDLSVVRFISDEIVVMYLGQIMEAGEADKIFQPPYHPYTEALLSAVPIADPDIEQKRIRLEGEMPSVMDPPKGCRFSTRCPRYLDSICEEQEPPNQDAGDGHVIKCHIDIRELAQVEPIFNTKEAAE
ncbi:MAG: ABC transporter ATP-binding protein [Rhodospirillaceae bacterium]|nr:ABC transporter ATP-binding protein [Rhodospirillaceae bacterium]|tara:strand:- start:20507 stop:22594 length:2088 start_codon:yes stop_codon:yes gene_type:complete